MAESVLRLDSDDMLHTLETVNPVAVLAEQLIKRTIGHPEQTEDTAIRLIPWADADSEHEYVLSVDESLGLSCAMPAVALRTLHTAALAAIATRELLTLGGVTVAVLGTWYAAQTQLTVLARHVTDIVHVAVRITDKSGTPELEPRLVDQLDLVGIGLSVTSDLADTLFGANLVVAASDGALDDSDGHPLIGNLVRGTVLVNASGHDLPTALLDQADQIFVDDITLLTEHTHRHFVDRHFANAAATTAGQPGSSWLGADRRPAITTDLGMLLAGTRVGRQQQDDILAVELLSTGDPDVHLATTIAAAARDNGLGRQVSA